MTVEIAQQVVEVKKVVQKQFATRVECPRTLPDATDPLCSPSSSLSSNAASATTATDHT